ncbi:MAG: Plasmid stabilization system [Candidatus Nomurabacteria bacterium GW2011_GWA2_40_9]|uniref:Plasmid stabilization system n=1 Tax=Candidatus Nomurabacteria bacterium GW2011_GWA2_40_9 TaxID=1618734 RepID=A0A0G0W1G7_9BACT|nr:MAG: Plasmid stabilization system [Candidatus Nomurabacteria bacterium GW2011_GWA2_40_9]
MIISYTPKFKKKLREFPKEIREKFYKQANLLSLNLRHPSLHAKKFDESSGLWQARVDGNVRFYFFIEKDIYSLINIRRHK